MKIVQNSPSLNSNIPLPLFPLLSSPLLSFLIIAIIERARWIRARSLPSSPATRVERPNCELTSNLAAKMGFTL